MQDTEVPINKPANSGGLFKIFLVVIGLALICLCSIFWAANSSLFATRLITYAVNQLPLSDGSTCKIASISGCILEGIEIPMISIKSLKDNFSIKLEDIKLNFSFGTTGKRRRPEVSFACNNIEINGFKKILWLNYIPKIPASSCFVGTQFPVFVKKFVVDKVSVKPFQETNVEIKIASLSIDLPGAKNGKQRAFGDYCVAIASSNLLKGSFKGLLRQSERKLNGLLELMLIKQTLSSEISLFEKKGVLNVSGNLASTTISVEKFSQWLIPLWQDQFPFGFDGDLICKGTWAYNKKVGFLGNFSGSLHNIRMVALGLFYPIFTINADWSLFNNNIVLKDTGSSFVGLPADLTGKVEKIFSLRKNWNLDFKCHDILVKKLIEDLPWGLRYSLSLPPMIGSLTFDCSVRGINPDVFVKVNAKKLSFGEKIKKEFKGSLTYFSGEEQGNKIKLKYEWAANKGFPELFDRFVSNKRVLSNIAPVSSNVDFIANISGPDTLNLRYFGSIDIGKTRLEGKGRWFKGGSSISFRTSDMSIYNSNGIELIDFVLAE